MNDSTVLKKNSKFVSRVIDQETILMPLYKTSHEINAIYTLNPAAAKAWEMFDGKKTIKDVKDKILDVFDTTPQETEKQLSRLLKDLMEINALTKNSRG
jgi:methyltransferase-like protein